MQKFGTGSAPVPWREPEKRQNRVPALSKPVSVLMSYDGVFIIVPVIRAGLPAAAQEPCIVILVHVYRAVIFFVFVIPFKVAAVFTVHDRSLGYFFFAAYACAQNNYSIRKQKAI